MSNPAAAAWRWLLAPFRGDPADPSTGMSAGARHAVIFLFVFAVALAGVNLLFTAMDVNRLRDAVHAQCQFSADLGSAPIMVSPSGKPSRLGVTIVSDSRVAWHGLGCPGRLPPPAPSFAHWAAVYHLPVG